MKPLSLKPRKPQNPGNSTLRHFTKGQGEFLALFGREEIRKMIAGLQHDQQIHFMARMYNMHDVFADLLKLSGPSQVHVISYSITEFPLRILSQFLEQKIITGLDFLLDFTVSRTPELKQFARHFANRVRFTDIHSKILLIRNDSWKIALLSSANFTRNNRFENGVIFSSADVYDQYLDFFEKIFENATE